MGGVNGIEIFSFMKNIFFKHNTDVGETAFVNCWKESLEFGEQSLQFVPVGSKMCVGNIYI